MKRTLLTLLAVTFTAAAFSQNPVIRGQYTADPTARVFEGKVWLYTSHDIISPVEPERRWFCMEDYHAFSSEDLVHWTDHGVILDQKNVPWGNPEGYSMWAPDCVYRNGKYYFYFPNAPKGGRGFAVGVAVAEHPDGPYKPEENSIQGVFGIDPCVLVASDGHAYIYWSGMGFSGAKLKDNMTELDGQAVRLDASFPAGQKEGPFIFEREGKFYLTYPWVQDRTECLAYAMSDSPLGPFEYKGKIMEKSGNECWTNHHSFVEYNGQWYLFYHHNDYSPDFDKNRSVRIDKVRFNPDGTIEQVTPTFRGVGVTPASGPIQIDRYSGIYHVATGIDFLDPAKPFDGWFVHLGRPGTWVRYDEIDFGASRPSEVTVRYRAGEDTKISLQLSDEESLGTFTLPASSDWKELKLKMTASTTGIRNLKVRVDEGGLDLDWIQFN
ncbi:MAG: family 43 glycosylhydrolase [Bacteroidales bacterium]|nr:family 43 glycosylhydrolase [Bacteroidales bacterium]